MKDLAFSSGPLYEAARPITVLRVILDDLASRDSPFNPNCLTIRRGIIMPATGKVASCRATGIAPSASIGDTLLRAHRAGPRCFN